MFHFYTPWKHQKTEGFVLCSRGVEMNIGWKWVKKKSTWSNKLDNTPYLDIFRALLNIYNETFLQKYLPA